MPNVKAPDGSIIPVDRTEGMSDRDVLRAAARQFAAKDKPKEPETVSGDAPVKSGGGLTEFAKSIPTGAANVAADFARGEQIESEQRASAFGDVNAGPKIPTGHELNKAFGLHEPQGYWGEAGQLTGEFAVNPITYFGPQSAVAKFLTTAGAVFGGAAGKEAGGPMGELMGLVGGGMMPAGILKGASPVLIRQGREAAAQLLESEGVKSVSAGQRTGNKAMMYGEGYLGDAPFAGGKASALKENQGKEFTRAVLRRAGVDSDVASDKVIDGAFKRLGTGMDQIGNSLGAMKMDGKFLTKLDDVAKEYDLNVQEGSRRAVVQKTVDDFVNRVGQSPVLTGEQLMKFRSNLLKKQRGAFGDPEYSEALGGMIDAVDDLASRWMQVSGKTDLMKDWAILRRQYRNLITIANASTGAGSEAAEGVITPARLRTALTSSGRGRRDYSRGRGDLAGLSHAGNLVMTPLPDSGTAQRAMLAGMASAIGSAGGYLLAGGSKEIGEGAVAGAAAPGMVGRGIMSKPAQSYLGGTIPGQAAARAGAAGLPGKGETAVRSVVPAIPEMVRDSQEGSDESISDMPSVPMSQ